MNSPSPKSPDLGGLNRLYFERLKSGQSVAKDDPVWQPYREGLGDECVDTYLSNIAPSDSENGPGPRFNPDGKPASLDIKSFGGYVVAKDYSVAQGGLNSVHRVDESHFDRPLAVKVPLVQYLKDDDVRRHLLREADLCARLQHPNIVPVYKSGWYPDDENKVCPYFSMQWIDGDTLLDLIKQRADQSDRLPYFLSILAQVSGAVSFAHENDVIHCDLKPGNVMVGKHDEVHVMDWGLARETSGRADAIPERVLDILGDSRRIARDRLFGTAAYAAPELARKELVLTTKADVFALGGMLTHILTGDPVYTDNDSEKIWRLAEEGEARDALRRLRRCKADRQLVKLAISCLSRTPSKRPTAMEMAKKLRDYPIRIERRSKQLTRARAWTIVILVAGVAAFVLNRQAESQRLERVMAQSSTEAMVEGRLGEVGRLQEDLKQAHVNDLVPIARRELTFAQQAVEIASRGPVSAAVHSRADAALREAKRGLEGVERDRLLLTSLMEALVYPESRKFRRDISSDAGLADIDRLFGEAFRKRGLDPERMPVAEVTAFIRSRPDKVATELVAGLDQWGYIRRIQRLDTASRLFDVAESADHSNPSRRDLRRNLATSKPPEIGLSRTQLIDMADRMEPSTESTLTILVLANGLWEVGERDAVGSLLRKAVRVSPQDALLRVRLGVHHLMRGAMEPATTDAEKKSPIRLGQFQDAVACFDALRVLRPESRLLLATALLNTSRSEEGRDMIRELQREREGDPMLLLLEASKLADEGNHAEADRKAEEVVQGGGSGPLIQLGRLMQAQASIAAKQWDRAETICHEIIKSTDNPRFLATAHEHLAAALHGQGRRADALRSFGESFRISDGIPSGHAYLARKLEGANDLGTAEQRLLQGLVEDPGNMALIIYSISFYERQNKKGDGDRLRTRLSAARLPDDYPSLYRCGRDLFELREFSHSEKVLRSAIEIKPEDGNAKAYLAAALNNQSKHQEAQQLAEQIIQTRPSSHEGYYLLGWSLYKRGIWNEAEAPLRKAFELKSNFADHAFMLGDNLRHLKKYGEAETYLLKGLEMEPGNLQARDWLMEVQKSQQDLEKKQN